VVHSAVQFLKNVHSSVFQSVVVSSVFIILVDQEISLQLICFAVLYLLVMKNSLDLIVLISHYFFF
jgi:hypothetical protein